MTIPGFSWLPLRPPLLQRRGAPHIRQKVEQMCNLRSRKSLRETETAMEGSLASLNGSISGSTSSLYHLGHGGITSSGPMFSPDLCASSCASPMDVITFLLFPLSFHLAGFVDVYSRCLEYMWSVFSCCAICMTCSS